MSVAERATDWLEGPRAGLIRIDRVLAELRKRAKEEERRINAMVDRGIPYGYAIDHVRSDRDDRR